MTRLRVSLLLAAVLVLALTPLAVPWTKVLLTVALAKGLAVLGIVVLLRGGQVSFGHGVFFALSAYAVAFAVSNGVAGDIFALLILATVAAAVVGFLWGLFIARYRYIFFAMLNLAFSMVVFSFLEKFYYITGGSDGIRVTRPSVLGLDLARAEFEWSLFLITLAVVAGACYAVYRFFASPLGQALEAIKTNETRMEYLGVSAWRVMLIAYTLSAALAGLGGALLAIGHGHVTPEMAYWVTSGEFVFIAILGGAGHVLGAFAGALFYEVVRIYAAAYFADVWRIILGGALLAVIFYGPRGFVGLYEAAEKALFPRAAAARKDKEGS